MQITQSFVHHVFFWLNNPTNEADKKALLDGLHKLCAVPNIQLFHIGIPAETDRDVIETGYSFSWLTIFNNKEDEEIYQTHPIHLQFVQECKHLWSKVIVYDSI